MLMRFAFGWKILLVGMLICSPGEVLAELRAGASVVDITPRQLPVIINGGFLERSDDRVSDPLQVRCLALARL